MNDDSAKESEILQRVGISREDYRRTTAIHEAGHAVAFARLFPSTPQAYVSIDTDNDSQGHHSAPERLIGFDQTEEEAEAHFSKMAIYYCAGWASVKLAGYSEDVAELGCEDDFEKAGHRLGVAKANALKLIGESTNQAAVRRAASLLLEEGTLSGEHVEVLMSVSEGQTSEQEYQQYLQFSGQR